MSTSTSFLDRFLDPLTACFTPDVARRVVALQLDPQTTARLAELREKANEGALSEDEQTEYEEFVENMDLIAIIKEKAKAALDRSAA